MIALYPESTSYVLWYTPWIPVVTVEQDDSQYRYSGKDVPFGMKFSRPENKWVRISGDWKQVLQKLRVSVFVLFNLQKSLQWLDRPTHLIGYSEWAEVKDRCSGITRDFGPVKR